MDRYGREFRVFRPPAAEGERAESFHIKAIHGAADGSFWVGGENTGFSRFDPLTDLILVDLSLPADRGTNSLRALRSAEIAVPMIAIGTMTTKRRLMGAV